MKDFSEELEKQVRAKIEKIVIDYAGLDDQKMIDELVKLALEMY